MILHVYHCNLAVIRDYKSAPGKNRPTGTGRFPPRPGGADVEYLPPTRTLASESLGQLLRLFQDVKLGNLVESPFRMNWQYLEESLGLSRQEIRDKLREVEQLGLLRSLTINYDHDRWMKHSREKGCLVAMTCVEESDLRRDGKECVTAYCDAIDTIKGAIVGKKQSLRHIFVVPNGHLAARSGSGLPWADVLEVLQRLPPELNQRGYKAKLNSYGYTKVISLAINAHKLGYVLRVV
jgi:DNA-binding Lrp family transcriptional regulator